VRGGLGSFFFSWSWYGEMDQKEHATCSTSLDLDQPPLYLGIPFITDRPPYFTAFASNVIRIGTRTEIESETSRAYRRLCCGWPACAIIGEVQLEVVGLLRSLFFLAVTKVESTVHGSKVGKYSLSYISDRSSNSRSSPNIPASSLRLHTLYTNPSLGPETFPVKSS
jgi:hypothetical protein